MLKEKINKAFNAQVTKEIYSAYLYFSMCAFFDNINLKGFSNWMRVQAQEELFHANKFFSFVLERGGKIELEAIDKPPVSWKTALDVFESAYKHELFVSASINDLVALALEEKDFAAHSFLQWFVNEQVEEEAAADEIVQKLKLLGEDKGAGIFMMNNELGARVFTPPATGADAAN